MNPSTTLLIRAATTAMTTQEAREATAYLMHRITRRYPLAKIVQGVYTYANGDQASEPTVAVMLPMALMESLSVARPLASGRYV